MNQMPGISCLKPQGAFYVMMNISELLGKTLYGQVINSADDFGDLFLKKGLVCIVPCTGFGAPEFLRWSTRRLWIISRKGWTGWSAF